MLIAFYQTFGYLSYTAPNNILILEYHFSFALERARPWKKLSYNSKFPIGVEYVKQKMPECLDDKGSGKFFTFFDSSEI